MHEGPSIYDAPPKDAQVEVVISMPGGWILVYISIRSLSKILPLKTEKITSKKNCLDICNSVYCTVLVFNADFELCTET